MLKENAKLTVRVKSPPVIKSLVIEHKPDRHDGSLKTGMMPEEPSHSWQNYV